MSSGDRSVPTRVKDFSACLAIIVIMYIISNLLLGAI